MAANAVRAIALGPGARAAEDPPPLYSYDVESGRPAVTTPRYRRRPCPRTGMPSPDVDHLGLGRGSRGGYVVRFEALSASAVLASVPTCRQSWNPRSGPTLAVRLPRGERVLAVSLVPE